MTEAHIPTSDYSGRLKVESNNTGLLFDIYQYNSPTDYDLLCLSREQAEALLVSLDIMLTESEH